MTQHTHLEDSELELGDREGRLRGLGLGEGERFLGLPDLLCGVEERLRGGGERFRGPGEGLRSIGDRLRGLGDLFRWAGECFLGLGDRFRGELLRLRSSSFLGDRPLGDLGKEGGTILVTDGTPKIYFQ